MQSILQSLSLVVFLCIYAVLVRFAARIVRASSIGWLQAFQFAALVVALSILGRVVLFFAGPAPLSLTGPIGIALHLALGAWFFSGRALAADGRPIGWSGGAKLTAVALGLLLLATFVLFVLARALFSMAAP